jgi:hypothetical protein
MFMRMRGVAISVVVLTLSAVAPSMAADAPPAGWDSNADGAYVNSASGVLCPVDFKSFHFDGFVTPAQPQANVVGVCHYKDSVGRLGSIRVRQPGPVIDPDGSIAENDAKLLATDGSAPPVLMRTSTDRKTGASRITVTVVRNGYLVDCSVAQLSFERPRGDFPLYCTTIPGGR